MDLKSMAVEMPEVKGHPNRVGFRGVLTMVDVPSQRAPSGSKGHRVMLTRKAAEAALPSLLGMAVDYSPSFDKHDVRCKVGVITRADIVGRNVELGGYLFARDFPEIVAEIGKSRLSAGQSMRQSPGLHAVAIDEGAGLRSSLRTVAAQLLRLTESLKAKDRKRSSGDLAVIRAETQVASGGGGLGMSYEVTNIELANSRAEVWVLDQVTFTGAAILRRDKAAYRDTWIELA